jgi:choline kinase
MTAAIVLAAGRGARLGHYTRHLPKALVRVGGRSLLDWNLRALAECGVAPIVVVGGYRCEQLARNGIELANAPDWSGSGPFASLLAARPARFADGFVVAYADCPHHPSNVQALLDNGADIAVAGDRSWRALWQERHGDALIDAETYRAETGRLRAVGSKPHALVDVEAQFAGLLHFTCSGWMRAIRGLDGERPHDMTALLATLLRHDVPIADVAIHGRWCEVDSSDDLRLCRRRLRASTDWSHDWRGGGGAWR